MPLTLAADATDFVSVAEMSSYTNVTSATVSPEMDLEMEMMRRAAQDVVEGLVGPVLHRAVTETVTARAGVAVLSSSPVVSVTSVTVPNGPAVAYTVLLGSGILRDVETTGDVEVVYVAGRASVPDAVRLAALIIAGHLWETQRGIAPSPLADTEVPVSGIGYAIPNRAMDLLAPYLLPPPVA